MSREVAAFLTEPNITNAWQDDEERIRKGIERARLARAARAELAALRNEPLIEFGSVEELFAVIDERVRRELAARAAVRKGPRTPEGT